MANRSTPMTPPMTPSSSKIHQQSMPEKGPYIIASNSEGLTPLQRHCAFFDRNNDGILTPWDTFASFRDLGYGLLLSFLGTALVHFFFSYPTLDSWIPDPFFSIHLKNIHRCIHGSDSGSYNNFGTAIMIMLILILLGELTMAPTEAIMTRYDSTQKGGVSFTEGWQMIKNFRDINDPFGWFAAIFEWGFLWALIADERGVVSFEAIRGQYDGTLFYTLREQNRVRSHPRKE